MKKQKTSQKKDNRGSTLAEMIVTFALVGIFMVSAVAVITSAVITHAELTTAMYAQTVSETLLDKITGELAAAQAEGAPAMVVGDSGEGVAFRDRDRRAVVCRVQDGLLLFDYGEGWQDWELDENAYMGFRISGFKIEQPKNKNVLEISLTIQNLKTDFEYSVSRCTACYNFREAADWGKIIRGDLNNLDWQ